MDLVLVVVLIVVTVRWYKLSKIREEYLNLQIDVLEKNLGTKTDAEE